MRVIALLILGCLVACSSVGCAQKLQASNLNQLELGKTRGFEVRQAFGKPDHVDTLTDDKGSSQLLRFEHTAVSGVLVWRIVDSRVLMAEVQNDLLRAYIFAGTMGKNTTKIDPEASKKLVVGKTRREEVTALLGEPAGKALAGSRLKDFNGMFTAGVTEVWAWTTIANASGAVWDRIEPTTLFVKFDSTGRVLGTGGDKVSINPLTGSSVRERNVTK